MAFERLEVVVADRRVFADDLVALEFAALDGAPLPPFDAGAHVEVETPDGRVRPYSLCSDPADSSRYRLGVLRVEGSTGASKYLCDDVQVGDRLQISEPRNLFPLDETASRTVLVGGGIGITPLIAMAHRLRTLGADFTLHYCVRTEDRAVFAEEIRKAGLGDRLRLHLSQERRFGIAADVPELGAGTHVYVCGPQAMMEQVLADARDRGCTEAQLHMEYFDVDTDITGDTFTVQLASGESFPVGPDECMADLLIARGYDVEVSCEKGICGSCIVKVLDGAADHRDHYLTDDEKIDQVATCCSRALTPVLVLDL